MLSAPAPGAVSDPTASREHAGTAVRLNSGPLLADMPGAVAQIKDSRTGPLPGLELAGLWAATARRETHQSLLSTARLVPSAEPILPRAPGAALESPAPAPLAPPAPWRPCQTAARASGILLWHGRGHHPEREDSRSLAQAPDLFLPQGRPSLPSYFQPYFQPYFHQQQHKSWMPVLLATKTIPARSPVWPCVAAIHAGDFYGWTGACANLFGT